MTDFAIKVHYATQNNLKGISVEVPFGQLICVTGVSGSGKSTFVERCIVELAQYRHLALSGKILPNFYEEGAVSTEVSFVSYIKQGSLVGSNRSVVGTALGVLQKLRELIIPYAEVRDEQDHALNPLSADELLQWCQIYHHEAQLSLVVCIEKMVLGPVKRYITSALRIIPECSFKLMDADMPYEHIDLHPSGKFLGRVLRTHKDIYAISPELKVSNGHLIRELFENALVNFRGRDMILVVESKQHTELINLTQALLSLSEPTVYYQPSEALLSFNSNARNSGQCPACKGTGKKLSIAQDLVFKNNNIPLTRGGLGISFNSNFDDYLYFSGLSNEIRGVLAARGEELDSTWTQLDSGTREILIKGSSESFQPLNTEGRPKGKKKPFIGILQRIENKLNGSSSAVRGLSYLRNVNDCSVCGGSRLNHAARAVHFAGRSYTELMNLTLSEAASWLNSLLAKKEYKSSSSVITALESVCQTCVDVGLGHLQLNRATNTLSGGEAQRLRIARDLWARLDNACYVVDEPTRGLHTKDLYGVICVFEKLRTPQNCVILVEHNPNLVSHADRVIELGPYGGTEGGEIIYDGPPHGSSMLNTPKRAFTPSNGVDPSGWITVSNANLRTVFHQSLRLPLGKITCFTGVSGSGKTTLVAGVLMPALEQLQFGAGFVSTHNGDVACEGVKSFHLVYLQQSAIGGNYRSRILTYLGLAEMFRDWFYQQSEASACGMSPSHFSSNTLDGQCLTCEGRGYLLSGSGNNEVCPSCCGNAFNPEVSFVNAYSRSITEWLNISLNELADDTTCPNFIRHAATLASELGLGHLSLGRPIPSLSGGECQRLRIIKALLDASDNKGNGEKQHLVLVMDEPSAGLHPNDVMNLIIALKKNITEKGHTLLLIEHNLLLIERTDWIVDIGPGSAADGGKILFSGCREAFIQAELKDSPTYLALKGQLAKDNNNYKPLLATTITSGHAPKQEAVERFKRYLQSEDNFLDEFKSTYQTIVPAYAYSDIDLTNQTFARATGIDTLLYRLFAAESNCASCSIFRDIKELEAQALALLQAKWRIGWFPSPVGTEVPVLHDIATAIKGHLKPKNNDWFDGEKIQTTAPNTKQSLILGKVRLLFTSELEPRVALSRALSLGKGWVSLVCAESGEVRELSLRALDPQHMRLGSRWQMPQIFDSTHEINSCQLCKGKGYIESVDKDLIFKDKNKSLNCDELFQQNALEVLKLARRKEMLPAAKRLKDSALLDLTKQLSDMGTIEAEAFWFGYPYKSFLKVGGDKNTVNDWYRWQGINRAVLLNMWKCSSREWAKSVHASRHQVSCPTCGGSGLGWEARNRVISGISLQDIYLHFSFKKLQLWLKEIQLKSDESIKIRDKLNVLADKTSITHDEFRIFERLKNLSEQHQQTALCIYLSNHALNNAVIYQNTPQLLPNSNCKIILPKEDGLELMKWDYLN